MDPPRLIRQSEGLQEIPYPEDFGLDTLVDDIFVDCGRIGDFSDFLDVGAVIDYARDIIYLPETDVDSITSRQEVLQEFMAHPNLVNFVLNEAIPDDPLKRRGYCRGDMDDEINLFQDRKNRVEAYLRYAEELTKLIPESSNSDLESVREHVIDLLSKAERIKELKAALEEIEKPGKLTVEYTFNDMHAYFRGMRNVTMERKALTSYRRESLDEHRNYIEEGEKTHIDYKRINDEAAEQIKKKTGRNVDFWGNLVDLELVVDEETQTISGTATYNKLALLKTIFSFKKQTTTVKTEVNIESVKVGVFNKALGFLNARLHSKFLESYDREIHDFGILVTELRYVATLASYFDKLGEGGVHLAMPEIVGSNGNQEEPLSTVVDSLMEPNLIRELGIEKVVPNDVNAYNANNNVFLITGPNDNGKTTYMNSIGIGQAMAQAGLLLLATRAVVSPKDTIYTHYIRPGDMKVGESRYAHELSRIKEIFEGATRNSLILMDEPCSGTSPEDGIKEADTVFRNAGRLGATTFVSTHYHDLASTAEELPYANNLMCVADSNGKGELVYTYRIEPGSSRKSEGLYLARIMGADDQGLQSILTERAEKGEIQLRAN